MVNTRTWKWAILAALPVLLGCRSLGDEPSLSFQSSDPTERVAAVRRAAQTGDQASLPHLVERLEDEDPVVRFAAICALQELTGRRLGYPYSLDSAERDAAVTRWREYLQQRLENPTSKTSSDDPAA